MAATTHGRTPTRRPREGRDLPPHPRSGVTRVALYQAIPQVLEELGVDADATLAAAGLSRADLADPENQRPYAALERLLIECERRTGCEHFGLLICRQSGLDQLGLPGRVARCAGTVRAGLHALIQTYNLNRGAGIVRLEETSRHADLIFALAMPGTRDTRQYQMGAVTIVRNLLAELCGEGWQATEVRLAFRSPANTRPFQRVFEAPVHFDASECAVVFESHWLDRPLPDVEESYRRAVSAELHQARMQAFEDFPALVRDVIREQLSRGACSIDTVSAALAMHRCTLDRRLTRHGESYGSLRRAVRLEMAEQLLRETDLSVQQIADHLHFSSAANFSTAFRQWSGATPTRFRNGGD